MKKVICVIVSILMVLSLTACGGAPANTTPTGYETNFKVAIVQQLDHSSLDEIRIAVDAQLKALAKEAGVGMVVSDYNGQNDASNLNQIGAKVVSASLADSTAAGALPESWQPANIDRIISKVSITQISFFIINYSLYY